jgi:hypothetical protein
MANLVGHSQEIALEMDLKKISQSFQLKILCMNSPLLFLRRSKLASLLASIWLEVDGDQGFAVVGALLGVCHSSGE